VPVPYPAHCILHQLVGDANARELMYHGAGECAQGQLGRPGIAHR
jgi:hypothetical protein